MQYFSSPQRMLQTPYISTTYLKCCYLSNILFEEGYKPWSSWYCNRKCLYWL